MTTCTLYRSRSLLADLALLAVALIWGGGFIASKEALTALSPFGLMSSRFLLSAALMFLLFSKHIVHASKRNIQYGVIVGAIQFIAFIFQLNGLSLTTVERQSFLVTLYVLFVPFLSFFAAKNPIRRRDLFCACLAMIGLAFLCLQSGIFSPSWGDILSIISAVCFAAQIVYIGNFVKDADIFSMTFFQLLTPGVLALPFIHPASLFIADMTAIGSIAYLVLLNTVVAFSLQNMAQQYTSDSHTSLILSMESLFGFLLAVLYYGNAVSPQEYAGCAIILAAILLANNIDSKFTEWVRQRDGR